MNTEQVKAAAERLAKGTGTYTTLSEHELSRHVHDFARALADAADADDHGHDRDRRLLESGEGVEVEVVFYANDDGAVLWDGIRFPDTGQCMDALRSGPTLARIHTARVAVPLPKEAEHEA